MAAPDFDEADEVDWHGCVGGVILIAGATGQRLEETNADAPRQGAIEHGATTLASPSFPASSKGEASAISQVFDLHYKRIYDYQVMSLAHQWATLPPQSKKGIRQSLRKELDENLRHAAGNEKALKVVS